MPEILSGLEFRNLLEVSHLLPTRPMSQHPVKRVRHPKRLVQIGQTFDTMSLPLASTHGGREGAKGGADRERAPRGKDRYEVRCA